MSSEPGQLHVLLVAVRYLPHVGGLEMHVYEVGRRLVRADFFQERLRLPVERFAVIPNGAHLYDAVEPTGDAKDDAENDEYLIISVGRLERYKGHQRVLRALPKVLEQVPNTQLHRVGEGPHTSNLQKMAREPGIARHVEIRSFSPEDRGDMASLIAKGDLVTLLGEYESQGTAIMEALVLLRPVLVTRTSALEELATRNLARAIPLESTPEEVATAVITQWRQPLVAHNVALPTRDACVARLLALYQPLARRVPCVS